MEKEAEVRWHQIHRSNVPETLGIEGMLPPEDQHRMADARNQRDWQTK